MKNQTESDRILNALFAAAVQKYGVTIEDIRGNRCDAGVRRVLSAATRLHQVPAPYAGSQMGVPAQTIHNDACVVKKNPAELKQAKKLLGLAAEQAAAGDASNTQPAPTKPDAPSNSSSVQSLDELRDIHSRIAAEFTPVPVRAVANFLYSHLGIKNLAEANGISEAEVECDTGKVYLRTLHDPEFAAHIKSLQQALRL